jgi:hypothetical protein
MMGVAMGMASVEGRGQEKEEVSGERWASK